ncbi:hypothetical protein FBU59_000172 [Linderina macrospora]|uniref:Uncharacterized protein n=1 Tax=Linderina macrospora TaxID=4868 RepID=A0ACC1JHB8_9FUNG|nr:hypothetical protein FBU59_000172 [Linderina macrospora]
MATSNLSTAPHSGLTVKQRLANYKPTELRADLSHLTDGDKHALVKLADVSDLLNAAYFKQIWSGATKMRQQLQEDGKKSESAHDLATLFELFRGPWDKNFENEVFVPGAAPKPKTANVYPSDITREEFDAWVSTLTKDDQKRAKGFYDTVHRGADGKLGLTPYADEYKDFLEPASKLMHEAAALVSDASFAEFLRKRGDAFVTNKYLDSEVSWLTINHTSALESAIGPYETYEDELFSAKAFFESMVHVRDFEGTAMLDKFTSSLEFVEKHLPIPADYRNKELTPPPIVVVNQVYYGGDTSVPMTAAYNLPNDEEAIERAGSKLTMIKNVQQGKVVSVLNPIAQVVLNSGDLQYVTFDAFFTHVLMHEVAHSNGPHRVKHTGDTVRSHLQELHSAFEEAKADITGLFAARLLVESGVIDNITLREFYTTYLASAFRSVRFGLTEAHGLGQAMQLNYLLEKGGFVYDSATKHFGVDLAKIDQAVSDLTHDIMMIQGDGDKKRAVEFRNKYGVVSPAVREALDSLKSVPIDIAPIWVDINNLRKQFN